MDILHVYDYLRNKGRYPTLDLLFEVYMSRWVTYKAQGKLITLNLKGANFLNDISAKYACEVETGTWKVKIRKIQQKVENVQIM